MRIVLQLPPKGLWPNDRVCWQALARARAEYRHDAHIGALEALGRRKEPAWPRATIQATFFYRSRRSRRDPDNCLAALKSAFDALQDAGVLATDRYLTHLPVLQQVDPAHPRVEIEIEETA